MVSACQNLGSCLYDRCPRNDVNGPSVMALLLDLVGRAAIGNDKETDSNTGASRIDGTRVDYQNAPGSDRIDKRLVSTQLTQMTIPEQWRSHELIPVITG